MAKGGRIGGALVAHTGPEGGEKGVKRGRKWGKKVASYISQWCFSLEMSSGATGGAIRWSYTVVLMVSGTVISSGPILWWYPV